MWRETPVSLVGFCGRGVRLMKRRVRRKRWRKSEESRMGAISLGSGYSLDQDECHGKHAFVSAVPNDR